MKRPQRNMSTPEARAFWAAVEADAAAVRELPEWKRAGVSSVRTLEEGNMKRVNAWDVSKPVPVFVFYLGVAASKETLVRHVEPKGGWSL